jgi:hypothetical protein
MKRRLEGNVKRYRKLDRLIRASRRFIAVGAICLSPLLLAVPAAAQGNGAEVQEEEQWPEAWFEVFRIAPGKHEEFVRRIARADEVARAGGQPPIQLFFHEIGAEWDVILFKPVRRVKPTPEQQAAMDAKRRELKMESGPAYFIALRGLVASHTDSKAYGPISADQWLSRLERWRAENLEGENGGD